MQRDSARGPHNGCMQPAGHNSSNNNGSIVWYSPALTVTAIQMKQRKYTFVVIVYNTVYCCAVELWTCSTCSCHLNDRIHRIHPTALILAAYRVLLATEIQRSTVYVSLGVELRSPDHEISLVDTSRQSASDGNGTGTSGTVQKVVRKLRRDR